MTQHYKHISVFILTIFVTVSSYAKPRIVQFDKELKNAKFIGLVIVEGYDNNGNILFYSIEYTDTIKIAFANYKGPDGYKFPDPDRNHWTGYWPFKKDTVLILIDSLYKVSLFAKKIKTNYRFWSPYYTGSIALFEFSNPSMKLTTEKGLVNSGKLNSCWDGCLLPVNQLFLASGKTFSHTGTAMMVNGKAAFASDFADSALYYLEGLDKWDEKYLNKRITILGQLVREGNRTFFMNWKILE
jgi:hypothetical protein